jgi:hypothetical protein
VNVMSSDRIEIQDSTPHTQCTEGDPAKSDIREEVITLSDQIVIPEFSSMVFKDMCAPKTDQSSFGVFMPFSNGLGRKRFNSSMLDLKKMSQRERFESASNISTNISNRSDFEFDRLER